MNALSIQTIIIRMIYNITKYVLFRKKKIKQSMIQNGIVAELVWLSLRILYLRSQIRIPPNILFQILKIYLLFLLQDSNLQMILLNIKGSLKDTITIEIQPINKTKVLNGLSSMMQRVNNTKMNWKFIIYSCKIRSYKIAIIIIAQTKW